MTAVPEDIPSDLTLEIGRDLAPHRFVTVVRAFFSYVEEVGRDLREGGRPERNPGHAAGRSRA